jgi:hypothetical protein
MNVGAEQLQKDFTTMLPKDLKDRLRLKPTV